MKEKKHFKIDLNKLAYLMNFKILYRNLNPPPNYEANGTEIGREMTKKKHFEVVDGRRTPHHGTSTSDPFRPDGLKKNSSSMY